MKTIDRSYVKDCVTRWVIVFVTLRVPFRDGLSSLAFADLSLRRVSSSTNAYGRGVDWPREESTLFLFGIPKKLIIFLFIFFVARFSLWYNTQTKRKNVFFICAPTSMPTRVCHIIFTINKTAYISVSLHRLCLFYAVNIGTKIRTRILFYFFSVTTNQHLVLRILYNFSVSSILYFILLVGLWLG